MGYTTKTLELVQKALETITVKFAMDLGAQNLFDQEYPDGNPYASTWYNARQIRYDCIDLNGENAAMRIDLGQQLPANHDRYDLVVDAGTSEHVGPGKHDIRHFYNCLKAKHELCKTGGIIVSENPKTGSWPKHGFNYYTKEFYEQLAKANGYDIIDLGEHPAMGNEIDGWNVYCIVKKVNDNDFMTLTDFKTLPICTQ